MADRMRALFLVLLLAVVPLMVACANRTGRKKRFVWDHEQVLTSKEVTALDSLFADHERRTGNEIVLVTHPSFHGRSPRDFAVAFGDSLGVGKRGLDNGVVIAYSQGRRAVFIATGKGTERVLHDSTCQRFVNERMLPRFKEDKAFPGLWEGGTAIVRHLDDPRNTIR